jgi:DNA-binding CsgD family transcriptional regulator
VKPRELFCRGELSACIRAAASSSAPSDRILEAYALERLGRYGAALAAISKISVTGDERIHVQALEAECHLLEGEVSAGRALLNEIGEPAGIEARFELAYARMLSAWVEGSPDAMDAVLAAVDAREVPELHARWLFGSSWAAALRGDYQKQLALLEEAVRLLQTPAAYDVTLLATATRCLVHLVRELASPGSFEFAVAATQSIPWTRDLECERFLTFRGLAWAYALRGSHETALSYACSARDIAPSRMWVTACYADQAYLARMAREDSSSNALLRHAISCAKEIEWISPGEERVAILNLVELAADRDVEDAKRLLEIYDGIAVGLAPHLALARDQRLRAMEAYARGTLLAASGSRAGAVELLQSSYSIFASIGYAWRAAAAALRLNAVTEEISWLRLAADAVQGFPESSVAEEIRKKAAGVSDPRAASLTPAQRRVYRLICQGLPDKEIAAALRLSPETVKNHAARVRGAFGVRSRAALIAAAQRNAG